MKRNIQKSNVVATTGQDFNYGHEKAMKKLKERRRLETGQSQDIDEVEGSRAKLAKQEVLPYMMADWAGKGYFELVNIQRLKYPNLKFEPASYNPQLPVPT